MAQKHLDPHELRPPPTGLVPKNGFSIFMLFTPRPFSSADRSLPPGHTLNRLFYGQSMGMTYTQGLKGDETVGEELQVLSTAPEIPEKSLLATGSCHSPAFLAA